MAASQQEKGCVLYRFTADLKLSNRFILTELWETEEDLKAHFAGQAFTNFFAELPSKGRFVSYTAWQGPLVSYVPPCALGAACFSNQTQVSPGTDPSPRGLHF